MIQRLGSSLVKHGQALLSKILPTTPESAGSFTDAFSKTDGRVQTSGAITTNTGSVVKDGTKVDMQGTISCGLSGRGKLFELESNTTLDGARATSSAESIGLVADGKSNITLRNMDLKSTWVTPSGNFAYAYNFANTQGVHGVDLKGSGYTGGVSCQSVTDVVFRGMRFDNMIYHPSLVAGGYGVVAAGRNMIYGDLLYKCHPTNPGRHGVYITSYNVGGVNQGNVNGLYLGGILDYTGWTGPTTPAPGINIRECDKVIITNYIIDGTSVSGVLDWAPSKNMLITGNIIRALRYDSGYAYGVGFPIGSGTKITTDSVISNNIISIAGMPSAPNDISWAGMVVNGERNMYQGNHISVPALGSPILVRAGTKDAAIIGNTDPATSGNEFIRFDGAAERITLKGNVTGRKWFRTGNLTNVTDMSVDFTRVCEVSTTSSGTTNKVDTYELINNISFSGANMVIAFNSHVTQEAIDGLQLSYPSQNTVAVIVSRASKTVTFRVTDYAGTVLPNTTPYTLRITLHS